MVLEPQAEDILLRKLRGAARDSLDLEPKVCTNVYFSCLFKILPFPTCFTVSYAFPVAAWTLPLLTVPFPASIRLTTSNMATAILGASVFFARLTMAALQYEARWTNAAYDAFLAVLWACSAAAQNGPDFTDPQHLSMRPWYLERSCDEAWAQNWGWCRIAKWEYGWAILAAYAPRPLCPLSTWNKIELTHTRSFYTARMLGALGWSAYEKGNKDGRASGPKMRYLLDDWACDGQGTWIASSYKDDTEELGWA